MKLFFDKIINERSYYFFFLLFTFFSAIFCGYTRVNNLFHLASLIFIITLFVNPEFRRHVFCRKELRYGIGFAALYMLYYSISDLWGEQPRNIGSTLTHSLYILIYLAMLVTALGSNKRTLLLIAIVSGFTILAIFLMAVDFQHILHNRLEYAKTPGPDNVIDVGGYFGLGIILSLIIFKETQKRIILIASAILFIALLLTQSRGPLIALVFALAITSHYRILSKKNLGWAAGVLIIIAIVMFSSGIAEMMIQRFLELSTQVYLRLSIWRHSLEIISTAPYFGLGVDKTLQFINYSGEHITTTHSLYLAMLLKGGAAGFLLFILLLGYGAWRSLCCIREGRRLEAAVFVFMCVFYVPEGMANIGNPGEFWYLFWFPFGLLMVESQIGRKNIPIRKN